MKVTLALIVFTACLLGTSMARPAAGPGAEGEAESQPFSWAEAAPVAIALTEAVTHVLPKTLTDAMPLPLPDAVGKAVVLAESSTTFDEFIARIMNEEWFGNLVLALNNIPWNTIFNGY